MARDIVDKTPDPVSQFQDLISGFATRDAGGLPLGDVFGHALNRLSVCYGILESAKLAASFAQVVPAHDGIPPNFEFAIAGAVPQDKPGTREYPAAHLAPCTLKIGDPAASGAPANLFDVFADGVTRAFVFNLFGKTERVHKLANYSDGICERNKSQNDWVHVLAACSTEVVRNRHATPREVFFDALIPRFQVVAGQQLVNMESTLGQVPPPAESLIVDQTGQPYGRAERPTDVRIHSPSPAAWRANREAVVQILAAYSGTHSPRQEDVSRLAHQFKALRSNEEREARGRNRAR